MAVVRSEMAIRLLEARILLNCEEELWLPRATAFDGAGSALSYAVLVGNKTAVMKIVTQLRGAGRNDGETFGLMEI